MKILNCEIRMTCLNGKDKGIYDTVFVKEKRKTDVIEKAENWAKQKFKEQFGKEPTTLMHKILKLRTKSTYFVGG